MDSTFSKRIANIEQIWRDNRWLYLFVGFGLGILALPITQMVANNTWEFLESLAPEAVGILFTVIFIEGFNRHSRRREAIERLIREMRSPSWEEGARAVFEAAEQGYLKDGSLDGAMLRRANLANVGLGGSRLRKVRLQLANLSKTRLWGCDMRDSDFTFANLAYAHLDRSNLSNCNFQNADFSGAVLMQANLKNANLEGAIFSLETVLPDSVGRFNRLTLEWEWTQCKYWTPETDMCRYTDPNHPNFWQPDGTMEHHETGRSYG